MRKLWFFACVALLAGLLMVPEITDNPAELHAQENVSCEEQIAEVVALVEESCGAAGSGQACYGAGSVTASGNGDLSFTESGDLVELSEIESLQTAADEWGVAVLQVPSGNEQPVTLALFGEAEITNTVKALEGPLTTLEISNGAGYNVNLREGPGTEFAVAGSFNWNASGVVDGRTSDGEWLRLQRDEGVAWIFTSLANVNGDVSSLAVVESAYTENMQAFNLQTVTPNEATCGAGSVGLLVQYDGEAAAQLGVNGLDLEFTSVTLLLQATDMLEINVLEGSVDVGLAGETVTAETGETVAAELGGETGIEAVAAPEIVAPYRFALTEGLPMELVSETGLSCVVGFSDTPVAFRTPGEDGTPVELQTESHYSVVGWTPDSEDESARWWKVNADGSTVWVPETSARTAGACNLIDEVAATTAAPASGGGGGGTGSNTSVVPGGQTIWSASSGPDNMTGTCNYPPLVMCDHLVAINVNGDTLSWRGQEPTAYTMYRAGDNTFSYSGRNKLNNGSMSMVLTFNGVNSWNMTMTQVFDNDPSCTHTFYYSAVPR